MDCHVLQRVLSSLYHHLPAGKKNIDVIVNIPESIKVLMASQVLKNKTLSHFVFLFCLPSLVVASTVVGTGGNTAKAATATEANKKKRICKKEFHK